MERARERGERGWREGGERGEREGGKGRTQLRNPNTVGLKDSSIGERERERELSWKTLILKKSSRERERELNSKTLILKYCSIKERDRQRENSTGKL